MIKIFGNENFFIANATSYDIIFKYIGEKAMKKLLAIMLVFTLALTTVFAQAVKESETNSGTVVLYTASSQDQCDLITELWSKMYPDIELEIVMAGTGELLSKLQAESANPQADVILGGSAAQLEGIKDCLEPYASPNLKYMSEAFIPANHVSTPVQLNINSFIINIKELAKLGMKPADINSWDVLLDPRLKGNISFADPSAAASALEEVVNMLATEGKNFGTIDESSWAYIDKFIANLSGKLQSSSSNAYKNVVAGEYAIGLTNEDKAVTYTTADPDNIAVGYPSDGITLRSGNCALVKNGPNGANGKLLVDFLASAEYQSLVEKELSVRPSRTDVVMTTKGMVSSGDLNVIAYPTVDTNAVKSTFKDHFVK